MSVLVYILRSIPKNRYYIGHTKNLERRLYEHNSGQTKSTKFGVPWEIVYERKFSSKSDAQKYEYYLKRMKSREYIESILTAD